MSEIIDTFGVDWRLLVIQALNFGLLLVVLWYFLYRPVVSMLEERRQKIEQGIKDSEKAQTQLSQLESQKEAIIADATKRGAIIVEQAKNKGYEKEEELLKDAQNKHERILSEAKEKAEGAKHKALEESKQEIASMAVLGAEKILRKTTQ